jgi:hypothetical protein
MNIKSIVVIISVVLCLSNARGAQASNSTGAAAVSYNKTSVNGKITCTSTVQGPNLSENGSVSVIADGKGNLTSGKASYKAASGTSCNYTLSSGTYIVQSDGTGLATTNWSLVSQNSSPNCAPSVSNNAISFSVQKASFSAPTRASGSETGSCTMAASTSAGAQ